MITALITIPTGARLFTSRRQWLSYQRQLIQRESLRPAAAPATFPCYATRYHVEDTGGNISTLHMQYYYCAMPDGCAQSSPFTSSRDGGIFTPPD